MKLMRKSCLIVLLCMIFSACTTNDSNAKIKLFPDNTNITEQSVTVYEKDQLEDIVNFSGTLQELHTQYPIEYAKEIHTGYRVTYRGRSCFAILFFDQSEHKLFGKVCHAEQSSDAFRGLSTGQSLSHVQWIDPEGDYIFLYSGIGEPRVSTHCTTDGYMISMTYDDNNIITQIEEELL